jgi:phytanoyl-CoA hydroxylase
MTSPLTLAREPQASGAGYTITAPHGAAIEIPFDVEADDPYAGLEKAADWRNYYQSEGYVVVRNVIPKALCEEVRRAFASEVKPYQNYLYRQATANPERHVLTSAGYMLNSILNIQDLSKDRFPLFRALGLAIITHPKTREVVEALLGEPGKVVQTMYFEGNPSTWAHQDSYYLDSAQIGRMVAAWIAVEDIHPGAGRFYVYPKSHQIDMAKNGGDFDIAFNHDRYKKLVVDVINQQGLRCQAPALRAGDVMLWASKTIHGSLETREPSRSRASFTAHFIPQSTAFLQYQKREKRLALKTVNGVQIHHPKDQNELRHRAMLEVETRFPRAFRLAKRLAIKAVTR